jgi:cyanuric acid amidohydrolase
MRTSLTVADRADVVRIMMDGPSDVAGFAAALDAGRIDPHRVVAILGKTEGNGGVNDFTREFAHATFRRLLAERCGVDERTIDERVAIVMSGGTEGVLSPHATIFSRASTDEPATAKRLAIGVAATRDLLPEELGRSAQIVETARAVRAAMADAGIVDPADVHFVQIKCPLLTAARVASALRRGATTVTDDGYASMGYSRGASALGVALALGEIAEPVPDDAVLVDWSRASAVASTSAGIELARNVIVVLGNAHAPGDLTIGHDVMADAIDLPAVLRAFAAAGVAADATGRADAARVVNVFAKAEAAPGGTIRGVRHTMLDDTDISATRHARAAVGGLIAGVAGTGAIYVSGGAEHQGPPGGGPIAVIARVPG